MPIFNIDKTITIEAEVEKRAKNKVSHIWNDGNCIQDKLGMVRWLNVKTACQMMIKDSSIISVTTECGVTVYRGKV